MTKAMNIMSTTTHPTHPTHEHSAGYAPDHRNAQQDHFDTAQRYKASWRDRARTFLGVISGGVLVTLILASLVFITALIVATVVGAVLVGVSS